MVNMIYNSKRRTTSQKVQQKKLYSQMDNNEFKECANLLRNCLRQHRRLQMSKHAQEKLATPLNFRALFGMIFKEDNLDYIIEYNETTRNNNMKRRILVRHPQKVKVEGYMAYLLIVIEIDTGRIITAFYNKVTDTHKTIDMSYYNADLKIIK